MCICNAAIVFYFYVVAFAVCADCKQITFIVIVWIRANIDKPELGRVALKGFLRDERRKSYIEIRRDFIKKFFPDLAPKAKKPTIYDIIDSL